MKIAGQIRVNRHEPCGLTRAIKFSRRVGTAHRNGRVMVGNAHPTHGLEGFSSELPMYIATAGEMNNIDRRTRDEYGIPTLLLMENAASGITRAVEQMLVSVRGKRITVLCGRGNNGGGGLSSARQLHNLE